MIQIVDFIGFRCVKFWIAPCRHRRHRGHLGATKVVVTTWGYLSDGCVVIDRNFGKIYRRCVVVYCISSPLRCISPSKIEWDLTNGPLSKLLELLDTQVSGSVQWVLLEISWNISAQYVCVVRVRQPFQSHGLGLADNLEFDEFRQTHTHHSKCK